MTHRERLLLFGRWLVLGALVGALSGAASALFLWSLERATTLRVAHEQLVFALPVAGLAIGWLYERYGQAIRAGNNLIIDTIHDDRPTLPLRLAPMVLVGTLLTHVFGGSAGREGTAVQMGAGLSDFVAQRLRLDRGLRRQLLIAGAAGGFGSVFGTPLAGAVFGLEFSTFRRIQYRALVPALVASVVGDLTAHALGIHHTPYAPVHAVPLTPLLLGKWLVFAMAIAAVTVVFVETIHFLKRRGEQAIPRLPLRMCLGGVAVVGMWQLVGTSDYLGLGLPTMVRAFSDASLPATAFGWKLLFTVVTLAAGFLGGEVTPLFFVGATLGNVLARLLGIPLDLGAGVGLAAAFGAAANTPVALSIMAVELFGTAILPHVALVTAVAYVLSGRRSIYSAQRMP